MPYTRRRFIRISCSSLIIGLSSCSWSWSQKKHPTSPHIRFAVIADAQYCFITNQGKAASRTRYYRDSLKKMDEAVRELNKWHLDFVIHLGDFLDQFNAKEINDPTLMAFEEIAEGVGNLLGYNDITGQSGTTRYHVLGNHDYWAYKWWERSGWDWDNREAKFEQRALYNLDYRYYSFDRLIKNPRVLYRFIVLDGTYPTGKSYRINASQIAWLKEELKKAENDQCRVIIFCHQGIYPEHSHNLENDTEIVDLITSHENILAFMNGHVHGGNYGIINNIHFLTFKGMVDKPYIAAAQGISANNAFSIVEIYQDHIAIIGFGRDQDNIGKHNAGGIYPIR